MKKLLCMGLILFLGGCGDSKHCLDGTKWKGGSATGNYEFRDGKVFMKAMGMDIIYPYECGKDGYFYLNPNSSAPTSGKINGDKMEILGYTLTKFSGNSEQAKKEEKVTLERIKQLLKMPNKDATKENVDEAKRLFALFKKQSPDEFAHLMIDVNENATKGNYTAMKSSINMYLADHEGNYPSSLNIPEFRKNFVDSKLLSEKITNSNRVSKTWDGQGGWVYDNKTGTFEVNVKGVDSKGQEYRQYGKN